MTCVTWGTNEGMTLMCLRSNMLLFFFLLAWCQFLFFQQGIKRQTLGWWWGGDKGVQGCQCRQQTYKASSRVYTIINEVSFTCNVGHKFNNKC